jgi:hypothetical protein
MIEREKTNHQKLVGQRVSDNFWFKPIWESGRVHTQEETLGQCQKTQERKENFGWSTKSKDLVPEEDKDPSGSEASTPGSSDLEQVDCFSHPHIHMDIVEKS